MRNRRSLDSLLHGEGAAISASLLIGVKHFTEDVPFEKWRSDFSNAFSEMRLEDQRTELGLQELFESISDKYLGDSTGIINSWEYKNLLNEIRGKGVPMRWDYERFLSEHSSSLQDSEILGGYQSDNSLKPWSDHDLEQIVSGNRVMVDENEVLGKRIIYEGHHGESIYSMVSKDYADVARMYDPDNIRIGTPQWHLEYGHGGNWQTPTDERYTDITDRAKAIQNDQREMFSNKSHLDDVMGIALGVAGGVIGAIIKYRQLRLSPTPWNTKKLVAIAAASVSGIATGILPYLVVQQISIPVRNWMEEQLLSTVSEGIASGGGYTLLNSLADTGGDFVIIMAAISTRAVIQGICVNRRIGMCAATGNFGKTIARTGIEQAGFMVIDILLDSIIPDPTGVVIALRIGYSLGKIGLSLKHKRDLMIKRFEYLHDFAIKSLNARGSNSD